MGQISILTKEQKIILDLIAENSYISENFYFTGGTALSEYYLHHRDSEDLDFFSTKSYDSQKILDLIESIAKINNLSFTSRLVEPVNIYYLTFKNGAKLKVDFSHYPYPLQKESRKLHKSLKIDSLYDIGVNKVVACLQRREVKDYVDLYFLLQEFTFWDLRAGVSAKFSMDVEPFLFASDVLAVEDFTFLPKMIKPLTLTQLKQFYRSLAKKLGGQLTD